MRAMQHGTIIALLDAQDWTDGDCGNSSAGALYQGIRGYHQMLNCV